LHKTVLSMIAWVLFGVLLIGRVSLRLARPLRGALDLERLRRAGAGVFRIEIRSRVSSRAALGLSRQRECQNPSLGTCSAGWRRC
jgi:hypothetical protein